MNATIYLGFNNWRLPSTPLNDPTCSSGGANGLGCTGSEMGHLFYQELGGVSNQSILTTHNAQFELFTNLQASYYWSSTLSPIYPGPFTFSFIRGIQDASNNSNTTYFSMAVRPGDVATVPVPAAAWLFGSGLLGLIGMARHKAAFQLDRVPDEGSPQWVVG